MPWCLVKHRDNFTFTFIFLPPVAPNYPIGISHLPWSGT